jgi:hypothetical protein
MMMMMMMMMIIIIIVLLLLLLFIMMMMMMTRTTFGSGSDCPAYQPRVMTIFQLSDRHTIWKHTSHGVCSSRSNVP